MILNHEKLNRELSPDEISWGQYIIGKVLDGGTYGTPQNLGLFRLHHKAKELHYLNGPLDEVFFGVATIFHGLGYSIHDGRPRCSKSKES